MSLTNRTGKYLGWGICSALLLLFYPVAALAQEAAAAAPAAPPAPDKGDTAWMLVSAALVLMMSIPGLALFYGGLVRSQEHALGPHAGADHRLHRRVGLGRLGLFDGLHRWRRPEFLSWAASPSCS